MGRAAAVLTPRVLAGALVGGALTAYYLLFRHLPNFPGGVDVFFVGFVLIPVVFALVYVVLPLRRWRGLLPVAIAFALLAVVASRADFEVLANFAKLGAATAAAFWFLSYFENALWVALVALLIPVVDAYSVWRGPTRHILDERPEVFTALSYAFPLPGERQVFVVWGPPLRGAEGARYDIFREPGGQRNRAPFGDRDGDGEVGWLESELDAQADYTYRVSVRGGGSATVRADADDANEGERRGLTSSDRAPTDLRIESTDSSAKLGLPDLLFFALFLAAADRFGLRRRATWVALTLSFGLTLAGTYVFVVDGLPALPLLAIAFLVANADLLLRAWRTRRDPAPPPA